MHTFTSEELLEFLFQETSLEKTGLIIKALEEDWNLREEYSLLRETREKLTEINFSPSQKSIDNILNYARLSAASSNA